MAEEKSKISAMLIFEIIGRPQNYIVESLKNIISQMGLEKGVKIIKSDVKEPRKIEEKGSVVSTAEKGIKVEQNEFYTTFADIEVEADDVQTVAQLVLGYMPAHVEIQSPEKITLNNGEMGDLLSDIVRKLHAYDEVARVTQVERIALEGRIRELLSEKDETKKNGTKKK